MRSEATPFPNLNAWWACHLVATLLEHGVRHVCVSPGSRSTPLVFALESARQAGQAPLALTVHHDERAAGFFALGVAKASRKPVALVCTSGTALAHYLPAVIEASLTGVPLVVVSADRPLELRGSGASQTIDQHDLFGVHVRESCELSAARPAAVAVRRMCATVSAALRRATGADAGPVHLNVPFDDPLAPLPDPAFTVPEGSPELTWPSVERGVPAGVPGPGFLPESELEAILQDWGGRSGLFIVGPTDEPLPALVDLAHQLGWPVWADVGSQLRDHPGVVTTADLRARSGYLVPGELEPRWVVQVGLVPTSSALSRWLEAWRTRAIGPDAAEARRLLSVVPYPARQDPQALADRTLVVALAPLFERLLAKLAAATHRPTHQVPVGPQDGQLEARLEAWSGFRSREAQAVHGACRLLPEHGNLVLASSMPIRYAEALSGRLPAGTRVVVNRGANGIDGLVSTTLGTAHATRRPTLAILGDVAMLHDVGGLIATREVETPVVFLVLNNDGGGIFSHLPVHRVEGLFEPYFGTPHGLNFEGAARMYGLEHHRTPDVAEALHRVATQLRTGTRATVVELMTDRSTERDAYRQDLADLLGLASPGEPRP